MANYSKKPQREQNSGLETIQQLNQLLTAAHKAAGGPLDPEVVNKLLSSVYETPATPTVTEILEEVENEAGIKLNPGLVLEIKSSPEKLDRITIDPKICLGQPTIRNMRITVSFIIKMLASTKSIEAVLQAYPELEAEDIEQALEYASWVVSDRIVNIPTA